MTWIQELQSKGRSKYSQGGQDGIVEYVFENIGTTNKMCVEFGYNANTIDGGSGSNTSNLVEEHGWSNIWFDSRYQNPALNLFKVRLTPLNLSCTFHDHKVPQAPDYVSIDVDSIDLWLLQAMLVAGYRPRLFSVEYNSNFPMTISATIPIRGVPFMWDGVYGASLAALMRLASQWDYELIYVEPKLDAFFMPRSLCTGFVHDFEKYAPLKPQRIKTPTIDRARLFETFPERRPLTDECLISIFGISPGEET